MNIGMDKLSKNNKKSVNFILNKPSFRRLIFVLLLLLPALLPLIGCSDPGQDGNRQGQAKEPKILTREDFRIEDIGMEFVRVEPGTFEMGSDSGEASSDERPVREVKISRPFWMGKHPVTQSEYEELMGGNPSYFKGANHPVEQVSWHDAVEFCEKLTEREADRIPKGYVYRLPTEAEWEYAARGGRQSEGYIFAGSDNVDEVAWYWRNSGDRRLKGEREPKKVMENNCATQPVGRKKPNELGIHDMSGNVAEWCYDKYHFYYYKDMPRQDPVNTRRGEMGSPRVNRSGTWVSFAQRCRSAARKGNRPDNATSTLGVRVVLAPAVQQ